MAEAEKLDPDFLAFVEAARRDSGWHDDLPKVPPVEPDPIFQRYAEGEAFLERLSEAANRDITRLPPQIG